MVSSRQNQILEYLNKKSPVSVEEFAEKFNVTEVTIRRDLAILNEKGLIARNRGEASLPILGMEPMYSHRIDHNIEEKKKLAKYAAEQINEGEVIALDIGTTAVELAKELLNKKRLTIFTSSFQEAAILSKSSHEVYMIGGLMRKSEMSMIGSIALDTIKKFNFDKFYLGLAGLSNEAGPTDYSVEEAEVKRAFIERSNKVIALVDKSKVGKSSLVNICDINEIDEIVTNKVENGAQIDLDFNGKLTFV
ncbi:DeoR/GlpR family DNA-binding transcription regulator [Fredinandcohnia onubensis]|uniref:DeoR/GlpR family DNA-binding transcription regulator n=1 Tax=Fredinandcohnia onubensis TaxID=1571209 RepID=UPI000C0C0B85|nr:DeoR/GlpR family DNA-binding transcription regulator [Fredinandcohnia onubensis]